jgi:hypothetical protein
MLDDKNVNAIILPVDHWHASARFWPARRKGHHWKGRPQHVGAQDDRGGARACLRGNAEPERTVPPSGPEHIRSRTLISIFSGADKAAEHHRRRPYTATPGIIRRAGAGAIVLQHKPLPANWHWFWVYRRRHHQRRRAPDRHHSLDVRTDLPDVGFFNRDFFYNDDQRR